MKKLFWVLAFFTGVFYSFKWIVVDPLVGKFQSSFVFAQSPDTSSTDDPFLDLIEKRKQMWEKILSDSDSSFGSFFRDMEEEFEQLSGFSRINLGQRYQTEWIDGGDKVSLLITPDNPEDQLELEVQGQMIKITHAKEEKNQHGTSRSSSVFMLSIPKGLDPNSVEMKTTTDNKIEMIFKKNGLVALPDPAPSRKPQRRVPPVQRVEPKRPIDRTPLGPRPGDINL